MRFTPLLLCLILSCATSSRGGTPEEIALERFQQAQSLTANGQYKAAIPHYAYAIRARNRMKGAYHGLAFCWEKLGDGSRAVEDLENLVKVDPQDERALRELGRLYTHRGLIKKAISAYEALEGRYPQMREEIARLESLNR